MSGSIEHKRPGVLAAIKRLLYEHWAARLATSRNERTPTRVCSEGCEMDKDLDSARAVRWPNISLSQGNVAMARHPVGQKDGASSTHHSGDWGDLDRFLMRNDFTGPIGRVHQ